MIDRNRSASIYHEDAELFRAALIYTAAISRFSVRLVEKDYFASLILRDWMHLPDQGMVFKGGTCLSKVYAGFYRLSEDLDFAISLDTDASRRERKHRVEPLKAHFSGLPERLPCLAIEAELAGFNSSTQYVGTYSYSSLGTGQKETIKVEVGLREPILEPALNDFARTLLIDPLKREQVLPPMAVSVMCLPEAYAEKLRAALTRREPAIRDFYDLDHAVREGKLEPDDARLLSLVRRKLSIPGTDAADMSDEKLNQLRDQLDAQLKPVLRQEDFEAFDIERAIELVTRVLGAL